MILELMSKTMETLKKILELDENDKVWVFNLKKELVSNYQGKASKEPKYWLKF